MMPKPEIPACPQPTHKKRGTKSQLDYCLQMHLIFMDQQNDPNPERKFITVEELAGRCELDESTIKRYLAFMRDRLHLPAWHIPARRGQGYTQKVHAFPLHTITDGEMFLFVLAKRAFGAGTPFARKFEPLCEKIASALQKDEVDLETLESVVHFHQSGFDAPMPVEPDLWDALAEASMNCREIRFTHLKAEAEATPTVRTIRPLALSEINAGWYIWGIEPGGPDKFAKKFALSRISDAELTGATFERIKFDPRAELEDSIGAFGGKAVHVHLHISGKSAHLVPERVVHHSQVLSHRADGSLDLILKVAHTPELEHWIMMRAGDVVVLEPASLREAIHSKHQRGAALNAPNP